MEAASAHQLRVLRTLAAKLALGLAKSWELPPAAKLALQRGIYSDALAELASIVDPVMSNVKGLLEQAMIELGERVPEQLEAAQMLTRFSVEDIAMSKSSPRDALAFLWTVEHHHAIPRGKYVGEALDIGLLMGFHDSYSCPNETFYEPEQRVISDESERRELLDRLAREEARSWLARHPT